MGSRHGVSARRTFSTGRPWEDSCGYSRAVRIGGLAETSLCSPCDETGAVVHPGDPYRQTLFCLDLIRTSLEAVGLGLADVIKTRIYVAHTPDWEPAGRAHGEVFRDIRPALGFIQMRAFFVPGIAVEVEVTAYRPE
jgi:enamine deaminase RidA (YjgF/YER057c/UK114 family)